MIREQHTPHTALLISFLVPGPGPALARLASHQAWTRVFFLSEIFTHVLAFVDRVFPQRRFLD